jgi:uncharacterized protein YbjT (DUF2867 family)
MLSRALVERGHAVRGTTRDPGRCAEIEAAGAQPLVADPDRVATLAGALEHVTVLVHLLGSAQGPRVADLHGPRLEMLLSRVTDSPVHAVVYEVAKLWPEGAEKVRGFGARTHTLTELLEADPEPPEDWLRAALAAVEATLGPR